MKTSKHLLSASNILLSLCNDDTLSQSQKISILQSIDTMNISLLINLMENNPPSVYKNLVIDVIDDYNKESLLTFAGTNKPKEGESCDK